jgi:hypothetical protein
MKKIKEAEEKQGKTESSVAVQKTESSKEKEAAKKEMQQKIEKKIKEHDEKLKQEVDKEKKNIEGYLAQLKSPRSMYRSRALYAIHGAYAEGKISKRTVTLVLLEAGKDTFPVVSTTAFTKLREITGEKIENTSEKWNEWWKKREEKRLEELKKKIEEELKGSAGKGTETDVSDEEVLSEETEEERKERLREEGRDALINEHNKSLGSLDRILLKNGRELTGYIIREDKNRKGEVIRYVIKFKGALGQMIVPASDVKGKPEYDIDKKKKGIMPLPVSLEKKP